MGLRNTLSFHPPLSTPIPSFIVCASWKIPGSLGSWGGDLFVPLFSVAVALQVASCSVVYGRFLRLPWRDNFRASEDSRRKWKFCAVEIEALQQQTKPASFPKGNKEEQIHHTHSSTTTQHPFPAYKKNECLQASTIACQCHLLAALSRRPNGKLVNN